MTDPTAQVQPNSQVTDIPLTERQRLTDDNLSTSLRFFNLLLWIGPNDRGQIQCRKLSNTYKVSLMYNPLVGYSTEAYPEAEIVHIDIITSAPHHILQGALGLV